MKKLLYTLLLTLTGAISVGAQGGYYFGVKGGLTIGEQRWQGIDRDPLLAYHGIAFMESLPAEGKFSLFAQLGYHVKGSAIRYQLWANPFNGGYVRPPAQQFEFRNLSLTLGAKQRFQEIGRGKAYYLLGVRLDYTIDTNLDEYTEFNELNPAYAIYPFDDKLFIREINYGVTAGGGIEFPFSEFVGALLEFTVNPDFSYQYEQPPIPNVTDPYTNSPRTIPERRIRNLTFEVTLGLNFLRKIEYYD